MEPLTSPQLFLRYAWPCAEEKFRAEKISENDFQTLKRLVYGGGKPETSLLEHCFPNAVKGLRNFIRSNHLVCDWWDYWAVKEYWHQHQGSGGDCAVQLATVCMEGAGIVQVVFGDKTTRALNFFGFDLQIGDQVYIHRQVIIEKIE